MNSLGGISLDMMPPIDTSNYECRYCGAECSHTYQDAYRADDPPRHNEYRWKDPQADKLKEVLAKEPPMTTDHPPPPAQPGGLRDLEAAIVAELELAKKSMSGWGEDSTSTPGSIAFTAYREQVGELERDHALLERDFTPLRQNYGLLLEFVQSVRKVAYDRLVEYGDTDENQEAITRVLHNYKESLDNLGEIVDILLASLSGSATADGDEGGER